MGTTIFSNPTFKNQIQLLTELGHLSKIMQYKNHNWSSGDPYYTWTIVNIVPRDTTKEGSPFWSEINRILIQNCGKLNLKRSDIKKALSSYYLPHKIPITL